MHDAPETDRIVIPKLSDVKSAVDRFLLHEQWDRHKIGNSPKRFLKSIERLLQEQVGPLPQVLLPNFKPPKDMFFYRVRVPTRHFKEQLITEYSYPPNHVIRSYQRCNIPHHPVFYCSDGPVTAIVEAAFTRPHCNPDVPFYLSEWKLRENMTAHVSPFLFGNVSKENPFYEFSESNVVKARNILNDYSEEEKDAFVEILKFLSTLFLYDNTYSISSFIAHSHLYAPHNYRTDIFLYPSIQTNFSSANFAIHPNCVQHKMELVRVYKLYVSDLNKETKTFNSKFTWTGLNEQGVIAWDRFDTASERNGTIMAALRRAKFKEVGV